MILFTKKELNELKNNFNFFKELTKTPIGIFSIKNPDINGLHFHFNKTKKISLPKNSIVITSNKHIVDNNYKFYNDDPKRLLAEILEHIYLSRKSNNYKTYNNNIIIAKDALIDENTKIGHNTIIENNVNIGKGSTIGTNCHIKYNVRIGLNNNIDSNCVVGSDGYGYSISKEKTMLIRHLGGVILKNNIDIGPQTLISAGQIDPTIIENNVKIDGQVYIGHNAHINKNSFICAKAVVGGSSIVGKNSWIYPQAFISNKVKIGNNSIVGAGSVVLRDVPDKQTHVGNIAEDIKLFQKKNFIINKYFKQYHEK